MVGCIKNEKRFSDEYEEALKAEKEYAKTTTEEEDLLQRDKGKRKIKIKKNEDFAIPNFKNYHITESIREDSLLSEGKPKYLLLRYCYLLTKI